MRRPSDCSAVEEGNPLAASATLLTANLPGQASASHAARSPRDPAASPHSHVNGDPAYSPCSGLPGTLLGISPSRYRAAAPSVLYSQATHTERMSRGQERGSGLKRV